MRKKDIPSEAPNTISHDFPPALQLGKNNQPCIYKMILLARQQYHREPGGVQGVKSEQELLRLLLEREKEIKNIVLYWHL